jgi:[ribosomal protein S5]-alanine N-acetyltransferase
MNPPGRIETKRLVLRATEHDDAAAVLDYQSDREVTRYLTFLPSDNLTQAHAFLERCARVRLDGTAFPLAITIKDDGQMIGIVELRPTQHGIEVGYVLRRSAWNNGFLTEALAAAADWALDQPDVFRVWAYTDVDNVGSQRVLEKAGFAREGVLHRWARHTNMSPEPRDAMAFARYR